MSLEQAKIRTSTPGLARCASRRGLTFLEVVCAVGLLAIVTASVTTATNYIVATQIRQQRKLNATEVANRLMLIYLDDPNELKRMGAQIAYDGAKYRWEIREGYVEIQSAKQGGVQGTAASLDRFVNVKLTAWLSEESEGAMRPEPGVPFGTVSRLVDPIPLRNPDSLKHTVKDDSLRGNLIERFISGGRAGGRPPAGGAGGRPGTSGGSGASGGSGSKSGGKSGGGGGK